MSLRMEPDKQQEVKGMVAEYKPIYTLPEVAEILRISKKEAYALTNSGQLPYLKIGRRKVRGRDLENFINSYPVSDPLKDQGDEEEA